MTLVLHHAADLRSTLTLELGAESSWRGRRAYPIDSIVVIDDRADWIVGEYLPERTLRAAQTRLLELSGTPAPATRPPP